MREYKMLKTDFWINPKYASFSLKAHLIAAYLMSCPHADQQEGFRSAEEYIAAALSFDKKTIRRAIQELIESDLLSSNFKPGWKLVHFFKDESKSFSGNKRKSAFSSNLSQYCKDV